jgi:AhpD family alkylhydroperoxidase
MMATAHEVMAELADPAKQLRALIPDVYQGYSNMQRAVMNDGELSAKVKELIALAIAATRECDGCIGAHARAAVRRGASEAEVAEAMGVVIMMNGGPGTVWGPRALAAYHEFSPQS